MTTTRTAELADVRRLPFRQDGSGPRTKLTPAQALNIERLLAIAHELGCSIYWADLGTHRRGEYDWRIHAIGLNTRLCGFQVVKTLGHELGHAMFGDRGYGVARQEQRADRVGSLLSAVPMMARLGLEPEARR